MKKNIWIINQAAGLPESGWGERHFKISEKLVEKGYQVTIFSGSSNHLFFDNKYFKGRYFVEKNSGQIQFVWVKVPEFKKSKSVKRIISWVIFSFNLLIIKKKFLKPDIILFSSSPMIPVLCAIYLKHYYKAKLVLEIRDIWPISIQQLGGLKWYHPFNLIHTPLEKFAYSQADYIVGLMKYLNEHVETILSRKFLFKWIPNGIDDNMSIDEPELNAVYKPDEFPSEKIVIGYVGTIGIANALGLLINTAEILNSKKEDIQFIIVGDGPEKKNLQLTVEEKNLSNISFINKIPKEKLGNLIKRFDFGIITWYNHPVYNYGVSANKYYDYMKASLPIITIGKTRGDPVEEADCGLKIESNDPKVISEMILKFVGQKKGELKKFGGNGHTYLLENNTYKILSNRYIEVFENV